MHREPKKKQFHIFYTLREHYDYTHRAHGAGGAGLSLAVGGGAVGAGSVAVHVHDPGDEVRRHADHQAVGDDRQHADGLQDLRPDPWEKHAKASIPRYHGYYVLLPWYHGY